MLWCVGRPPAHCHTPGRRHPATGARAPELAPTTSRPPPHLTRAAPPLRPPPSAAWLKTRRYDALGVAPFGPVDLDPASPTYGYITTTPKPGWKHTDVLGPLRAVDPSAPILFDTDVNAPQRGPNSLSWQRQGGPGRPRACARLARLGPAVQPWCLTEAPPTARISPRLATQAPALAEFLEM